MTRGLWIRNLLIKTINHQISIKDAISISIARFKAKPLDLMAFDLEFSNVDHILWSIIIDVFINEVYTPRGFEINPEDTIIDIGAHQGVFSGYASQKTQALIKSYEPNSNNYSRLCEFIARNEIANVETHQYAVAAESGKRFLELSETSSTHFLSVDNNPDLREGHLVERIQTTTLDLILFDVDYVDLVKIDCEGAEIEIFLEASQETLKKIKRISAEIHYAANDPQLIEMVQKLSCHFSKIKINHLEGKNLGYLYAW